MFMFTCSNVHKHMFTRRMGIKKAPDVGACYVVWLLAFDFIYRLGILNEEVKLGVVVVINPVTRSTVSVFKHNQLHLSGGFAFLVLFVVIATRDSLGLKR